MKQITIVIEDASQPVVADITALLGDADINIEMLDADQLEHKGLISLSVDRYDEAIELLREAGYSAHPDEAELIEVEDKPGALAKLALNYKEKGIAIRSMRIIRREDGKGLVSVVLEEKHVA